MNNLLGDLLLAKRTELGISLREASKLISISHSYLSSLEKGIDTRGILTNKPSPDTLKLISKAYNLCYNELLQVCGYMQDADFLQQDTKDSQLNKDEFTLFANRSDYTELPEEAKRQLIDYIEFLKQKYKKEK